MRLSKHVEDERDERLFDSLAAVAHRQHDVRAVVADPMTFSGVLRLVRERREESPIAAYLHSSHTSRAYPLARFSRPVKSSATYDGKIPTAIETMTRNGS